MTNPGLWWRTIRHLTRHQIIYQILNRVRSRGKLRFPATVPTGHFLTIPEPDKPVSFAAGSFTFLNQSVAFTGLIDWNYSQFGKLWTYHLNYFDFLNQSGLSVDSGLFLIQDFITQADTLNDGLEPYPTSLRIMNWMQFLSRNHIQNEAINRHLWAQTNLLHRRLEYHLSGNHLLENGFALLIGAVYFRHDRWLLTASALIRKELETQILADGGHYERSPVYHQLLLDRLLTVLLAVRSDSWLPNQALALLLIRKARQMLDWLNRFTFQNGDVPMVNDAAFGVAPTTSQLNTKARLILGIGSSDSATQPPDGEDSGYRMFHVGRIELFIDVGSIGPKHQPGHAHADTFSFVLHVDGRPIIVDPGTSIYQPGGRRAWERSTAAHNTVTVNDISSSEMWAAFRVGRRADTTILTDTTTCLTARHNGYRHLGITHERTWRLSPEMLTIVDRLTTDGKPSNKSQPGVARLFFQSGVSVVLTKTGAVAGPLRVTINADEQPEITLSTYELADGFNKYQSASCLTINFLGRLTSMFTPTV